MIIDVEGLSLSHSHELFGKYSSTLTHLFRVISYTCVQYLCVCKHMLLCVLNDLFWILTLHKIDGLQIFPSVHGCFILWSVCSMQTFLMVGVTVIRLHFSWQLSSIFKEEKCKFTKLLISCSTNNNVIYNTAIFLFN